ncbi:MAG TPA: bifunctional aspartate kinase/diaminopimelate decarboxylase [Thermoanaerobaculia bacterium]|jgi:diaminopimelate decarboxylase/aspartate kinase|nr:bifunctional aspartate kinase/diaminopimelate decarboxylase [Thermoanaerobaculia bacterium]
MRRWVVLKFGGTSVSRLERWQTIAALAQARLAAGLRPLIVCSALSGISDRLEQLLALAVCGEHKAALSAIATRHYELGSALGLPDAGRSLLRADFGEISRLALAASQAGTADPKLKAQVMAFGEILSTRLGVAYLASRGLPVAWHDARESLTARDEPRANASRAYLAATCHSERDADLSARFEALSGIETPAAVIVTQGFIARNAAGETVLLGRGGSDTSAALFAARLGAARCEIWTDVPGLFTANPALLPSARLLRALDYEEAQEIATTGAKVLHPRSIPPLRAQRIPLSVQCTQRPEIAGTVISVAGPDSSPRVKAISARRGITLVAMETLGMWQEVGFLADVFAVFARHGLSIDSVSTSETNVTVSLDPGVLGASSLEPALLDRLLADLAEHCEPRLIAPTAAISLVGRGIRAILHDLAPVFEVFAEMKVHLMTQSASDLNLTFIVDEDQAERLVRQLHGLLFGHQAESAVFGPSWAELFGEHGELETPETDAGEWWRERRSDLLAIAAAESPLYVYDAETLDRAVASLLALRALDRVFYSIKANHYPDVLARFHAAGLGFECVSAPELEHVRRLFPDLPGERLLFTPNFAPRGEYQRAFEMGAWVTIDSLHSLRAWPEVFAGRDLLVRLDPGRGRGHHSHVRTAGAQSKFGLAPEQLDELAALVHGIGARVVGLHAHSGSGIRAVETWSETALFLARAAERFPAVKILDVGGGLGVPEQAGQSGLDLAALDDLLTRFREAHPRFRLWLEPGRFLVAQAGVLLARVVQVKHKGEVNFVGLETGMNSLIRPALYGAHHPIVNLTRLDQPAAMLAHIVGPICETGDVLGRSRRIASAEEGDIVLIANAGAYGRVMSSRYNLREPAGERLLAPRD